MQLPTSWGHFSFAHIGLQEASLHPPKFVQAWIVPTGSHFAWEVIPITLSEDIGLDQIQQLDKLMEAENRSPSATRPPKQPLFRQTLWWASDGGRILKAPNLRNQSQAQA